MTYQHRNGRPQKFGKTVRERIDTTMIVRKLAEHVQGREEMTATQLKAAEILLRKTVPDLSAQTLTIEETPTSRRDIEAQAIAYGIDPKTLFGTEDKPENSVPSLPAPQDSGRDAEKSDPPTPRLADDS